MTPAETRALEKRVAEKLGIAPIGWRFDYLVGESLHRSELFESEIHLGHSYPEFPRLSDPADFHLVVEGLAESGLGWQIWCRPVRAPGGYEARIVNFKRLAGGVSGWRAGATYRLAVLAAVVAMETAP